MEKKVMVITGAYGGLGAALARASLKKGFNLALGGKDGMKLQVLCQELGSPTEMISVECDVGQQADCFRLIDETVRAFGRVDVLINNAGMLKNSPIQKITPDELWDTFETNVFGVVFCCQAALNVMRKQDSGIILNIGSSTVIDYKANHVSYGASKSAVLGLTGNLRKELEGTGITACVFSPGGMKTNLFRDQPDKDLSGFMDPAMVAEAILAYISAPIKDWHVVLRRPAVDNVPK